VKTLGRSWNIVLDGSLDLFMARRRGTAFDAAFAKLLWLFVEFYAASSAPDADCSEFLRPMIP